MFEDKPKHGMTGYISTVTNKNAKPTNYIGSLSSFTTVNNLKKKPVFLILSLTFVLGKTLPENQLKCRFENSNVLVRPNYHRYTKREIYRLAPRITHYR